MALAGVRGPFKGAYFVKEMSRSNIGTAALGTDVEVFEWTVPAGMDITVVNVQVYASNQGTPQATIDVEDDATTILTGDISLLTTSSASGTLATASGVRVAGGSVLTVDATYAGTTTAVADLNVTIIAYVNDHPNSVRTGSNYRGSGEG